jgi:hypothetical protein
MNDEEFDINKLDEKEREFYNKIKGLTDIAYKRGYMDGIKDVVGDDGERVVKRIVLTPSSMLAFLIILLGGIFSLGMYIGGLNG